MLHLISCYLIFWFSEHVNWNCNHKHDTIISKLPQTTAYLESLARNLCKHYNSYLDNSMIFTSCGLWSATNICKTLDFLPNDLKLSLRMHDKHEITQQRLTTMCPFLSNYTSKSIFVWLPDINGNLPKLTPK